MSDNESNYLRKVRRNAEQDQRRAEREAEQARREAEREADRDERNAERDRQNAIEDRRIKRRVDKIVYAIQGEGFWLRAAALVSVAALLVSVLTVFITTRDSDAQLNAARDTEKRQLRAYVGMDDAMAAIKDGNVVARIVFKNAGQTPALNVKVRNRPFADLSTAPGTGHPLGPVIDADTDVMIPGGTVTIRPKLAVDSDTSQALDKGTDAPFVVGQVDYDDIFGCHHSLAFLLRGANRENGVWSMEPLPNGNGADPFGCD